MKRRSICILLALIHLLSLGGCVSDLIDTQGMMSPPKANTDQQEIHHLLQGTSPNLTFVYPKTGDYRSAIIIRDLNGDGKEDAIGFIALDAGIEVQFLEKTDAVWRSIGRFRNAANEVDRVCFGDVTGDGLDDILIGWGNAQSISATLGVYSYQGVRFTETLFDTKYDDLVLTDFDGDQIQEIFLLERTVVAQDETMETIPARAEYFSLKDGAIRPLGSAEADSAVTKFSGISFGAITKDLMGVVSDGAKSDGSMTTQIFFKGETGQLQGLPRNPNVLAFTSPFLRPTGPFFTAMDINQDGFIEIPTVKSLPALPPETVSSPDSTSFLVDWNRIRPQGDPIYLRLMTAFMNVSENYWFRTPHWLESELTAVNDPVLRTVVYHRVETGRDVLGEEVQLMGPRLFGIRVFSRAAWEERAGLTDYDPLIEEDEQIYALVTYTKEEKYLTAIKKIKETFSLLA